MPVQEASYRQWTAKRRIVSYGGRYDFTHHMKIAAINERPIDIQQGGTDHRILTEYALGAA